MGKLVTFEPFIDALYDFVAGAEKELEKKAENLVLRVFDELVEQAPQWSGDFAANYRIGVKKGYKVTRNPNYRSVTFSSTTVTEDAAGEISSVRTNAQYRGAPAAVNFAKANARQSVKRFRIGDEIFIYNKTPYDGELKDGTPGPQVRSLEGFFRYLNQNPDLLAQQIRPVNLVGGQVILYEHVIAKYL